jgi:tetratricopeptide (TPR) repeat protein
LPGVAVNSKVETKPTHSAHSVAAASKRDAQALALLTDSGNSLYDEGRLSDALECFQQALVLVAAKKTDQGKRAAICHYNLARTCAGLGMPDKAIEHYQTAISIRPRFLEAHNNLGMMFNELNRFEEAIPHFKKAIAAEPLFAASHYGMGVALQSLGNINDAAFCYQKALTFNPDFYASWVNLGLICFTIKSWEPAINCYNEAIALMPDNPELYYDVGLAYLASGDCQKAIQSFGKAIELKPDYEAAKDGLQEAMYFALAAPAEPLLPA